MWGDPDVDDLTSIGKLAHGETVSNRLTENAFLKKKNILKSVLQIKFNTPDQNNINTMLQKLELKVRTLSFKRWSEVL